MQDALYQEKKKWIRSMNIKTMKNERPESLRDSIIKSTNMQEKYCFICQSLGKKVE